MNGPGLTQTASFGSQRFCSWPPQAIRTPLEKEFHSLSKRFQCLSNSQSLRVVRRWNSKQLVRVDRRRTELLLRESSSAHLQKGEAFCFASVIGYSNAVAGPGPPATQSGDFVGKMYQPGVLGRPLALRRQSIRDIASCLKLQCPRKRRKKRVSKGVA